MYRQVLEGMRYLVERGMVHRDIKAANVLIQKGTYKLTDFGFARMLGSQDHA